MTSCKWKACLPILISAPCGKLLAKCALAMLAAIWAERGMVVISCMLLFQLPLWPNLDTAQGASRNLSKNLGHYAVEMEYYYQKPRPEMLPDLLKSLDKAGQLGKSENRLMTGAFLAELAKKKEIDLKEIYRKTGSRNIGRTLAWGAHLAGRDEKFFMDLLQKNDPVLASQISDSPAALLAWNLYSGNSVLKMYWAAFMATGNTVWVDRIIDAALVYARNSERGINNEETRAGAASAASLYELAPGHEAVRKKLKERLQKSSEEESKTLAIIIGHSQNKSN